MVTRHVARMTATLNGRRSIGALRGLVLTAPLLLGAGPAAAIRTHDRVAGLSLDVRSGSADHDDDKPSRACEERVEIPSQAEDGLVEIRIWNPCRAGATLRFRTDHLERVAQFDADGRLGTIMPLFSDPAPIRWQAADGRDREVRVDVPGLQQVLKVVLVWNGEAPLSLQIDEAVLPDRPPTCTWIERSGSCRGVGRFASLPLGPGRNVDLYTVALGALPPRGRLPYHVVFDPGPSGSGLNADRYCGDGASAAPLFEIWSVRRGMFRVERRGGFSAIACGDGGPARRVSRGDILLAP